jgi:hypothetical protein
MLTRQVLVRCSVLAVLIAPIAACTSLIGVDDRELNCFVAPEYPQVMADATSTLTRTGSNMTVPQLVISLDKNKSAVLVMALWNGFAMHGVVNAPGKYPLIPGDQSFSRCGICVTIQVYSDENAKYEAKYFTNEGTLELIQADTTKVMGALSNLKFQRANVDRTVNPAVFVPLNNGCEVSVPSVTFDKMYM